MPLARSTGVICLVTDRRRLAAASPSSSLVDCVAAAADAGVDLIHIRERDLEARPLANLVHDCIRAVRQTSAQVVVNDRADVAIAAGAHGVHLREDSFGARRLRSMLPSDFVIGRSVHDAGDAARASREGSLDYLILGTLFPSVSKPSGRAVMTMPGFAAVAASAAVPVLPIGGITMERAEQLVRAGAPGIAAIGLFLPPPGIAIDTHLRAVVQQLRMLFDTCRAVP